MKRAKISVKLIGVIVFSMIFFHNLSYAGIVEAIVVTDLKGEKVKLTEATFGNYAYPYSIDLIIPTSPKQIAWIDTAVIKIAIFKKQGEKLNVSVTTNDGQVTSGIFDMTVPNVHGKGPFGEISYNFSDIKSLEFVSKPGVSYTVSNITANYKLKKWKLVDGNNVQNVEGLCIWDNYQTHRAGSYVYPNKWFPAAKFMCDYDYNDYYGKVPIQKGLAKISVAWDMIKSFEITGKIVEGKPEVIVIAKDGSTLTGQLLMMTHDEGAQSKYGMFNEKDALLWRVFPDFGTKGVSLLPLRKISFSSAE